MLFRSAFANKYRVDDTVYFTYFGDGAANQGQVYESFNMAALWKLPVIFVVENNRYAMGTSLQRAASTPDFYTRGEAFGIAGAVVDGMDVLAVKAAGELAVEHCRSGNGPYVLEVKTYRYRGHSMSDPARYRSKEEVRNIKDNQDPIDMIKEMLIQGGHASQDDLKSIDKDIKKIVQESADFAIESPEPDLNELYTDILV